MKLSREGAISNLRLFFGDTGADYVAVDDIFTNAGRSEYPLASNKKWLYNRLTLIKPYGLFEKVNGVQNGVRVTQGLALTAEGHKAVYDSKAAEKYGGALELDEERQKSVTIQSVRQDIAILRQRYPEFDVIFDIRLKSEED